MLFLFLVIVAFLVRTYQVLSSIQNHRDTKERPVRTKLPLKTLVVLGSGGHTTEMLQMIQQLNPQTYDPLVYIVATTDDTSERRINAFGGRLPSETYFIPRSREVGQSYVTSIASTLYAMIFSLWIVFKTRPALLLCNGPGTCIPVAAATLLARVFGLCEGNVVFVESFCRVESLSLTGRILYPIADMFLVHWDELHAKFPRSQTVSTFVPNTSRGS
ncbi:Oligosaccharide biosynthesis protein Alg14 like [Fragilaria crotonensis]|nr:Oligosaccharide biosynthesis protein Alg14 like [Fragilaria crotonensis]